MGTTFFVLALLQCALLFFLSRVGSRLDREERKPAPQRTHWPRTGLIVPAGGNHPRMREALESLLKQDYPALYPVIVTATADEPAAGIARELQARYPQLRHVVAGFAKGCGQKNHNSLKGVEAVEDEVELLAFCDSTHIAPRDFIRRLVAPVVDGEDFSTGYHKVVARDTGIVTMAYALCPADALSAGHLELHPAVGRRHVLPPVGLPPLRRARVLDDQCGGRLLPG